MRVFLKCIFYGHRIKYRFIVTDMIVVHFLEHRLSGVTNREQ